MSERNRRVAKCCEVRSSEYGSELLFIELGVMPDTPVARCRRAEV